MNKKTLLAISPLVLSLLAWRWWADRPSDGGDPARSAAAETVEDVSPRLGRETSRPSRADRVAAGSERASQGVPATATPSSAQPPLRAPIIQAIRATGLTPQEKRKSMLRAIEHSGASQEPWTEHAQRSFDTWRTGSCCASRPHPTRMTRRPRTQRAMPL